MIDPNKLPYAEQRNYIKFISFFIVFISIFSILFNFLNSF